MLSASWYSKSALTRLRSEASKGILWVFSPLSVAIHLWVEATWEVLVGVIMAWSLMKLLGVRRKIVETWLYIEVALMFGSGILGLGHHYFWIGTPEYWLTIGGFFSALEPIPLVAMVVHAVYDSGAHAFKNGNHPALA